MTNRNQQHHDEQNPELEQSFEYLEDLPFFSRR